VIIGLENVELRQLFSWNVVIRGLNCHLQIAESQPYIGECENFDNLEQDYAPDAQAFHEKILVSQH